MGFMKRYTTTAANSKAIFSAERSLSMSQGHRDWCYSNGHHYFSTLTKYELFIHYELNIITKVTVDNGHKLTHIQANRQKKMIKNKDAISIAKHQFNVIALVV